MSRGESSDRAAPAGIEAALAALCEPKLVVAATVALGESVSALAWSPSGLVVAGGTLGGEAVMWAPGAAPVLHECGSPVLDMAWSPSGELAVACEDGTLWWWPAGGTPVAHHVGATAGSLSWGEGGLAVAAEDSVVVMAAGGHARTDIEVPPGSAMAVTWTSPGEGAVLLVGGVGGLREVLVREAQVWEALLEEPGGESWPMAAVTVLAVDPHSGIAAAGTLGGGVEIGRRGTALQAGRDAVSSLAWSPKGSLLAAVADGGLAVWALLGTDDAVRPLGRLAGHDDWVNDTAFSAGGLLASVGDDGRVVLWDPAETADPLERIALGAGLAKLSWRPDGRALAVGGTDGAISVLDCSARVDELHRGRSPGD